MKDRSGGEEGEIVLGPNALDLSPSRDRGLLKEVLREGIATDPSTMTFPTRLDVVQVHYVGSFLDGTVFDSSRSRKEPFQFVLGRGDVIVGWELGVSTMAKGEVARLLCTPPYAYGEMGCPPKVPPNTTLVFEMELLKCCEEDLTEEEDGSVVRKKRILAGTGFSSPKPGAIVEVDVVGRHHGRVFDERRLTFVLGEGSVCHGLPEGVEIGLRRFLKGEKSTLLLAPSRTFGHKGHQEFRIPPEATVEYDVHLEAFDNGKESWEMDLSEKLECARIAKRRGTDFFKVGRCDVAIQQYEKVIGHLMESSERVSFAKAGDSVWNVEEEAEVKQLLLAAHLNLSMCHLKTGNAMEAKRSAERALQLDPNNEKGLFRRGWAHFHANEFDLALEDFLKVLQVGPGNRAAAARVNECRARIQEQKEKEKRAYQNMFS